MILDIIIIHSFPERHDFAKQSLFLVIQDFDPFLFFFYHVIPRAKVAPPALFTWFEVVSVALLSGNIEYFGIYKEGHLFSQHENVVRHDEASDHVDDVVSSH